MVGVALVIVLYAALNSFFLVLSLTLQDGLGLSALDAGLVYTPQGGAFFACSLLAGRFSRTYGRRILETGALITAGDPRFTALAEALYAASPEFRFWWDRHDIAGFEPARKRFNHPYLGTLTLDYVKLAPLDNPDIYLPPR